MATRISQSLLSSFRFTFLREDGYDDFLKTLNRIKEPPSDAMRMGMEFEGLINAALDGTPPPSDHKWFEQVTWCADYLNGSQKQVLLTKPLVVDDEELLLVGVLDFLRAGRIFDTKFSARYSSHQSANYYLGSPQHSAYFRLVEEAKSFEYIICDGNYIYRETYTPDEVTPIETHIRHFIRFVKERGLWDTFVEKWKTE